MVLKFTATLLAFWIVVASLCPGYAANNGPDECGAHRLRRFIGKPVADLQQLPLRWVRFICQHDCVGTADLQVKRLTVIYSKQTNRVVTLQCG
jgi:hypothetical protein